MQVNLLNVLLGTPANSGASVLNEGGGEGGADTFAQLLGDFDLASGQQGKGGANGLLPAELVPQALLAQEVGFTNARALLEQKITPQDAAQLIAQINDLLAQGQGSAEQQESWEQLKEALEPVAEGDQSVDLADILDQVPDLQLPQEMSAQDEHGTPLMRMLAWVQQALDKKREIAVQADDATAQSQASLAALGNGLQAIMFRADDRSAEAAQAVAEKETEIEVTAIADAVDIAALADAARAEAAKIPASPTVIDITPPAPPPLPEWLQAMTQGKRSAELDARIPPLELTGEDALPVVTLPQVASDEMAEIPADGAPANASAMNQAKTREQEWLKHLPFPLKFSTAPVTETSPAANAPVEMVSIDALAPLPDLSTANETANVILSDVAQGDEHASDAARPLTISSAPPAPYVRHAQVLTPQHPLVPTPAPDQVHVAIRNAVSEGLDRITIQLDPVELGRVEVRMDVGHDGRTHMVFTADKAATLDLLSRGAYGLERSLADGGVKADAGTMEFNLRQQPQFVQADAGQQGGGQSSTPREENADNDTIAPLSSVETASPTRHMTLNVSAGVDIEA